MSKVRAWLQLFRVPNLLTVPGDPLAGFLLATGGRLDERVVPAVIACVLLYMAGLAMNDLADQKEDAIDRPKRPLPSGVISRPAAIIITGNLIIFGMGLCVVAGPPVAMMGAGVLLGIILYDFFTKNIAVLGAINMGVCRGMSVLVGAAAGMGPSWNKLGIALSIEQISGTLAIPFYLMAAADAQRYFVAALAGALIVAVYIAAVTNLARFETHRQLPKFPRVLPLAALFLGYIALPTIGRVLRDPCPTVWVIALVMGAALTSQIMRNPPPPLPPRIGGFIRILPVMQAALCVAPSVAGGIPKTMESLICAMALMACVPLHAWLARKFYAS